MKSGLFDLITLWHVLEHLRNPVEVLGLARRLLKPEGTLVVAVPNVSGLSFRIFRRHWFALSPPWHLQQFKPRSLGLAFYEAGLTVEEIRAFGEHPMRLCWTDSLTGMIEAIPSAWYESPLRMALRILRRGVAVAMPLLLRIEQGVGLPGAIVAIGKKNKLVELTGI
jgi:SAM-dependent methyltransferase